MATFKLTERASAELLDIYLFGLRQFGRIQADRYLDELERCFGLLADNPRMGRLARKVGHGVRRHEHGSHVIFYEIERGDLVILAIVHGRSMQELDV